MKLTFLEARVPLTKTFNKDDDGNIVKIGHPKVWDVKSYFEEFETLPELAQLLRYHGAEGRCLLKGNVKRPLDWESRAGSTDPNEPSRLLCFDVDGLKHVEQAEQFVQLSPITRDADYVAQYSASSGVLPERGLLCHIFMLLDKPATPALLKQVLMDMNLTIPELRNHISLSRTHSSLRWPLDISTCQNDKLIYIAPPILGPGVEDKFEGDRVQVVQKSKRTISLSAPPSAEKNRTEMLKVLNQLRFAAGLPERPRNQFKTAHAVEYLSKPDRATITEIKEERGFVYMNLNGGDSWGYYHPTNNPEFILNFKGEPVYKTSELLPEYWEEVRRRPPEVEPDPSGRIYLAFRDFKTATYWNGIYDTTTGELRIAQAKSESQLRNFLMQYHQPVPDYVPDWDVVYDPHSSEVVNAGERRINLYRPSDFAKAYSLMTEDERAAGVGVPPTIERVLRHVLGGDGAAYEHMLNWLAVALQTRDRTLTCWVWQGIQGTGKGLMLNQVLRPMFGQSNVTSKRMEELDSDFNGFLERCQLLFVDEAQLSAFQRNKVIEANLKNYIVEPWISVRHMFQISFEARNYLNLIFASNKSDPVVVDPSDRRFNVGAFQPDKLVIADEEVDVLAEEAWPFFCHLMQRRASRQLARTPLENEARRLMVHTSLSTIDEVCRALKDGDLEFFEDHAPTDGASGVMGSAKQAATAYKALMDRLPETTDLTRDELYVLANHIVGRVDAAPGRFRSYMKHHDIHLVPIRRDGKVVRGYKVNWRR